MYNKKVNNKRQFKIFLLFIKIKLIFKIKFKKLIINIYLFIYKLIIIS